MNNSQLYTLWQEAFAYIKANCSETTFDTWLKSIEAMNILNDRTMLFIVPNNFYKNIIETRYDSLIKEALNKVFKKDLSTKYLLPDEAESYMMSPAATSNESVTPNISLDPRYTFSSFVTGNSNMLAYTAAMNVAHNPGRSYNPLFIYGGSGLGKTHLMHAIGHMILEENSEARVTYVTSERFTNDLINSFMYHDGRNTDQFREKYRNLDALLIDDIQFIGDKERTQEEFFHTFNELYQNRKQIIINSDRQPKEIPGLMERLRTRFESGLIVDIMPPDYETRVAILRKKAIAENLNVDDEVLSLIAQSITSNIRELEGALNKLKIYGSVINVPLNVTIASSVLKDSVKPEEKKELTPELIKETVCNYFHLTTDQLDAKTRKAEVLFPRQISQYLCRELLGMSYPKIAEFYGGMNHTTIMSSCDKVEKQIMEEGPACKIIQELRKQLNRP